MDFLRNARMRTLMGMILLPCMVMLAYKGFVGHAMASSECDVASYYVDFNRSMKTEQYPDLCHSHQGSYLLSMFSAIYDRYSLKVVKPKEYATIPKVIHIMWLGGSMPTHYESFVASWRIFHPQWKIIFWTDNALNYHRGSVVIRTFDELQNVLQGTQTDIVVDASGLAYENKDMYDAAINYGEKSDILKWEIVYRFGGVYVDIDFEALKPLDTFHHCYDFYTGLQPLDTNMVQLGAALFAARPGHPILRECVIKIRDNRHIQQIIVKTGPIHFTRCFLSVAAQGDNVDIAFPASYFYPCDYNQKGVDRQQWIKPESFAVHHWAGSWLKPEAFIHFKER
jgi:mannosyltransferase OCH1-like enzyme